MKGSPPLPVPVTGGPDVVCVVPPGPLSSLIFVSAEQAASGSSVLNLGIEALEPGAGVFGGEVPVHPDLLLVALLAPDRGFAGHGVLLADAAAQALAGRSPHPAPAPPRAA